MVDSDIEEKIETMMSMGADAVKLCGGGASGFALILCEPEKIERIAKLFPEKWLINARVYSNGSSILRI